MEKLAMNRSFWKGKRVFLTGHTGFKGGWLALWLADMGAKVHGYALIPPTEPSLFVAANVQDILASSTIADIRDLPVLVEAMQEAKPEIVFHFAAQPLVRHSYEATPETYAVNVMGTVNLLEGVRQTPGVTAVINITTDKCYENQEWVWAYRENEALGGLDPYSSSKACSELVTAAYRHSFFKSSGVRLASARAGNVVGGGDWAADRLVPDFLRALDANRTLSIRSPSATRPWQHVLEPLSGYLLLAEKLFSEGQNYSGAWNFGPKEENAQPVQWIADTLCEQFPDVVWQCDPMQQQHEAHTLKLDSSKAKACLGWRQRWDLEVALKMTLAWHRAWKDGEDMSAVSIKQVHKYESVIGRE